MANSMKPKKELKKPPRKNAEADDFDDGEEDGAGVSEMPSGDVVKTLALSCAELDQKMAKLRGEKGAAIKNAEADHNVHRGALREALKQYKMEPQAREEYQRHVESYVLQLGIARQANLFDEAPAEAATFAGRDV